VDSIVRYDHRELSQTILESANDDRTAETSVSSSTVSSPLYSTRGLSVSAL
jgi:hypothetical protein